MQVNSINGGVLQIDAPIAHSLILLQFNSSATDLGSEEGFGKNKNLSLAQITKATGLPKETVKMCLG